MAVTRAGNAIRMAADGDIIAHAIYCNRAVVYAATDLHIRLRKASVTGNILLEVTVPATQSLPVDVELSMPAVGTYLEIVSGTGSVTLYSE